MTEITKDMIGCLCWFWCKKPKSPALAILKEIRKSREDPEVELYITEDNYVFYNCRPVKPDEIKFYKEK